MKKISLISLFLVSSFFILSAQTHLNKYYPVEDQKVQDNLDVWRDLKFGLFMHWGAYSQMGIVESWALCAEDEAWCRRENPSYIDFKINYENLKTSFNPVQFDPNKWAKAANDAGMRYLVFTAKHHDGFNMYDTKLSDYKITSEDCPFHTNPKADVTKEIFNEFRDEGFMIGAYLSKPDWNNENFWWPNFATPDRNVNYSIEKYPERWQAFVDFFHGQVDELMTDYGKVDILWMDGGWVRPLTKGQKKLINFINGLFLKSGYTQLNIPQDQDLKIDEMAEMARKKQPGLIVVDRHIEGPNENYLTPEQFIPDRYFKEPWESCITLGGSWSYIPNDHYKSTRTVIHMLCDVVSKNGSLLLNVGPSPEGTWPEGVYDRFNEMGEWMDVNNTAIYQTQGRKKFSEGKFRFSDSKDGKQNAIYLVDKDEIEMPPFFEIKSLKVSKKSSIKLLGYSENLKWDKKGGKVIFYIPDELRKNPPCDFAWTFTVEGK